MMIGHEADTLLQAQLTTLCRTVRVALEAPGSAIALKGRFSTQGIFGPNLKTEEAALIESLESRRSRVSESGKNEIASWASTPIFVPEGERVGTIYVLDTASREFGERDLAKLDGLAQVLTGYLNMVDLAGETAKREALFRLLAESSTDTIVRGDLNGIRQYVSPAVTSLLGYKPEELIGRRAMEIVHPDHIEEFASMMEAVRDGRIDAAVSEQRQRHKNGYWVWMEALVRLTRDARTGEPDGYVASVRDISRRKEAEERIAHMAFHDPLTGLPNRLLLQDRLKQEIAQARRYGRGFALLSVDLDNFKAINDSLGHNAGDEVLCMAAKRFRAVVRTEDTVARMGGDEFVILQTMERAEATSASKLATRLIEIMTRPLDLAGQKLNVEVSIGIALASSDALYEDILLDRVDKALYEAKRAGRNTYRVFEAD